MAPSSASARDAASAAGLRRGGPGEGISNFGGVSFVTLPEMFRRLPARVALVALLGAACVHEERAPSGGPAAVGATDRAASHALEVLGTPDYVPADAAGGSRAFVLPLAKDATGIVLGGRRILVREGTSSASRDVTDPPVVAVDALPRWMGGGYLFRSKSALYASQTFDGPLRPIVAFPGEIATVSFGPKSALVRATDGERWAVELPSGARAAVAPPGVVDFAALGDGRAAAMTEGGGALVSSDGGTHWIDVTRQLSGRPATVFALEPPSDQAGVWITQAVGPALRLDAGGRLSRFDHAPVVKPDPRAPDPRWHGDEPPLRAAVRSGAPADARSALVMVAGDVARVDLVTGALLSVRSGRLPPEATCEAVRTADDVIFACVHDGTGFVVARALGDREPVLEHAFAAPGRFYASDDGSLAYGGPCTAVQASDAVVCVRGAKGAWQELGVEVPPADAGAPSPRKGRATPVQASGVVRWVPRSDGDALAIVATSGGAPAAIDARSGEARSFHLEALPPAVQSALAAGKGASPGKGERIVDRTWTATAAGGVRIWTDGGVSVGLDAEEPPSVSPFTFPRWSGAGPYALGVANGGRVYQSVDHGASWVEVRAPLTGRALPLEVAACSAVGCDLGEWYRLGWNASSASAEPAPANVPSPPRIVRPPLPEMVCRLAGESRVASSARTDRSPEDLGVGAMRLPGTDPDSYVRTLFDRHGTNPTHAATAAGDASDSYTAPRVLFYGAAAQAGRSAAGLRRSLAFVAPFDTDAVVRKGSFAVSDLLASGRSLGMQAADILGDDPTAVVGVAPVASIDAGPADLVFFGATGAVGLLRPGASKVRVVMQRKQGDELEPVSAAATGPDEIAILALDSNGSGRVVRLGPSGVSDGFEVPAPPQGSLYPANVDALAVGPGGELGLLRTPSGADPPTAADPALLMIPGAAPVALAPWSTLTSAEDPACRADASGFRAVVQTAGPWIRLVGAEPTPDEDAPMLARVRWSRQRVCLDAVELRAADTAVSSDSLVETWAVVRLAPPGAAAKVVMVPGNEIRQPLACALAPAK